MNILPRIVTLLSHEKWRMTYMLNESLKIPQKSLALQIVPNRMILYRNLNIGRNDDLLLLQRNINKGMITRLKRWKSTQSSCEKDDLKQRQGRIEDHQQSAESCEEPREWRSDGYQISTESYPKTCNELLRRRECNQSIESGSPICSDKPVPYNNQQACISSEHGSYKSKQATRIISENWTCGKPATKRKIYYKCKPKSCTYNPDTREEAICSPSHTPRDYCKGKSDEITKDEQTATYSVWQCPESEPFSFKKITLNEKGISSIEWKIPKEYPAPDTHEYHIKPDPPPPRYPHWSENPPSYCDHGLKKTTCSSRVEASPMIFVPKKGPRKSQTKDIALFPQNIHEDSSRNANENECGRTDVEKSVSRKPRCVISFEDKCAATLKIPAPVNKTMESKTQQFPTLTRDGRCCVEKSEKEFVTSDVSDCNPNMASFKNRLSKCPCIKKMWGIGVKREPPVDVSVRQKRGVLLPHCKKTKKSESQPEIIRRKRRRFKSRAPDNGWARQRYKVRLKIFHKGNGRLDPCLPRIAELRQPRGEKMRLKLSKSAADKGEFSLRSRNSCPHSSSKMPIAETKSYPTKMDESRVVRDQCLRKHPCKKCR